jgi:hypothetical protein
MASDERRRFLQRLSALGLAGALGWEREALAQGERAPGVYRVRGTVRVNGKPAKRGLIVKPGDTVETGRGSQAVFVIGKDAFLLRASSRVETGFSAAAAQNAGTADNVFADVLRLTTGKLLSVFSPGPRRIETATATIGIRGTGLYLEVEPRRTYACTCYGEVELQPRDRPEEKETVSTTHHEQPRYIYADGAMPPGGMMQKAPVVNHTDAELILLESLVGRKPPFDGLGGYPYK